MRVGGVGLGKGGHRPGLDVSQMHGQKGKSVTWRREWGKDFRRNIPVAEWRLSVPPPSSPLCQGQTPTVIKHNFHLFSSHILSEWFKNISRPLGRRHVPRLHCQLEAGRRQMQLAMVEGWLQLRSRMGRCCYRRPEGGGRWLTTLRPQSALQHLGQWCDPNLIALPVSAFSTSFSLPRGPLPLPVLLASVALLVGKSAGGSSMGRGLESIDYNCYKHAERSCHPSGSNPSSKMGNNGARWHVVEYKS
jgi:hypothetical protein